MCFCWVPMASVVLCSVQAWFQRTTNTKWPMGYQKVTWPMTSHDPERSNAWPQYA